MTAPPSSRIPGTPGLLRTINDRAALELLLDAGPLTRSQIGDSTGVSRPTASQIVARLEQSGLIEPTGSVQGARGPQATQYAARTDVLVGLALDVVPDGVRASVVDALGRTLGETTVTAGPDRTAATDVRRARDEACADAGIPVARVATAVVGVQAAVAPRTGDLALVGELPGWPRAGLREHLEDALGIDVRVENDVNLAAIAERDAGRDEQSFALLWLGEGIGMGAWLDGRVHHGTTGGAGEIGYLPVPAAGIDDSVNVQDLVGGLRLVEICARAGVPGVTESTPYAAAVAAVREHRDTDAVHELVQDLARRVAIVLQPVVAILEPDAVVLGGPTGVACGDELAEATAAALRGTDQRTGAVVASAVRELAVLRGARSVVAQDVRTLLLTAAGRPDHPVGTSPVPG
ncbi:ROK family transcriptional regulator [Cellulosimicrobium cellulans]|uniref:ROK family transcriptional regulator n=1 Tax=Cellulosimicrobium cellulans TaxID=1710 RepID=UPI001EDBD591|nr:ROK family transcriptional regulator [Cellulosimicrobium cellulans]UKJ65339.1 ROK family transcriptional regulator [Cellulosimicrobium cellulans]